MNRARGTWTLTSTPAPKSRPMLQGEAGNQVRNGPSARSRCSAERQRRRSKGRRQQTQTRASGSPRRQVSSWSRRKARSGSERQIFTPVVMIKQGRLPGRHYGQAGAIRDVTQMRYVNGQLYNIADPKYADAIAAEQRRKIRRFKKAAPRAGNESRLSPIPPVPISDGITTFTYRDNQHPLGVRERLPQPQL